MTHRWPVAASLALLVAAVLAIYWPGLGGGFAFDDYPNIVFNERLHVTALSWPDWIAAMFSSNASDLQRPLAMATFAIQHFFTGLDPWPMKLANVLIHALNALLAFGCVRTVVRTVPAKGSLGDDARAFATVALWAVLPINLMAVLLVVQRMESLSHAFVFAGLWAYLHGRLRQQQGKPGGLLAFLGLAFGTGFGALCKESAVLLPLYAFCVEVFCLGFRRTGDSPDRRLLAFFGLGLWLPALAGGGWLLWRSLAPYAYTSRDFTLHERLITEPRVLFDYVQWTLLPSLRELSLFHDDYAPSRGLLQPPSTLVALVALPLLALAAWFIGRRRPLAGLGIAWFLAAHALTATFLPLELVYEHRNYFASLGVLLALVDLLSIRSRRLAVAIVAVLLAFYGSTTWLRAREWSDPVRFAVTSAAKHPLSPRATYQLGQTYVILSRGQPASPLTQKAFAALEDARRVPRSGVLPLQGLLMLASRTGRPMQDAWWREMGDKLRHNPIGAQETSALAAMTECAIATRCPFPAGRMVGLYLAALGNGENPEVMNIYGNYALNVLGDAELTRRLWSRAVELAPGTLQYRINLVRYWIARGRMDEARREIAALRALGSFGQNDAVADALEAMTLRRPASDSPGTTR